MRHLTSVTFIICIVVLCLLALFWFGVDFNDVYQSYNDITFYRVHDDLNTSKPSLDMVASIQECKELSFVKVHYNKAQFILFESLNNIDTNIAKIQFPMDVKWTYGIAASDKIASKSILAFTLRGALPKAVTHAIMPDSYIVGLDSDWHRLIAEHTSDSIYILKKNIQQQKDIFMTNDITQIANRKDEYVVIQRMLQDPYIVKERKCNMRVYVLIIIWPSNRVDIYYYDDGFMYYTQHAFKKQSINTEEVITTGLGGRGMYQDRPLTLKDFGGFLGARKYAKLNQSLHMCLKYFKAAYVPILMEENKSLPGVKFSIFGMDIAPDENLDCKILEVNKGPDLTPKDKRDGELKVRMVSDALALAHVISSSKYIGHNGFIRV